MENIKEKIYFANMDYGFGNKNSWLKITKDKNNIYFKRDENGVNAWHCRSLPLNDRRILEIKES